MIDVGSWLAERRPAPPADLSASLTGIETEPSESLVGALARDGKVRLEEAVSRPGRVREAAFRLLEADALVTYACEAALEFDDPAAELRRILARTGS